MVNGAEKRIEAAEKFPVPVPNGALHAIGNCPGPGADDDIQLGIAGVGRCKLGL